MKLIYVAGPYRNHSEWQVIQNIRKAETVAIEIWKKGHVAICPHLNTAHFGGILPDERWLEGDMLIIERCDAMCMVKEWQDSVGAQMEHQRAVELGMPIYYGPDEVPFAD
jgi:hypothetical protein